MRPRKAGGTVTTTASARTEARADSTAPRLPPGRFAAPESQEPSALPAPWPGGPKPPARRRRTCTPPRRLRSRTAPRSCRTRRCQPARRAARRREARRRTRTPPRDRNRTCAPLLCACPSFHVSSVCPSHSAAFFAVQGASAGTSLASSPRARKTSWTSLERGGVREGDLTVLLVLRAMFAFAEHGAPGNVRRESLDAEVIGERDYATLTRSDPLPTHLDGCPRNAPGHRPAADPVLGFDHHHRSARGVQFSRRREPGQPRADNHHVDRPRVADSSKSRHLVTAETLGQGLAGRGLPGLLGAVVDLHQAALHVSGAQPA